MPILTPGAAGTEAIEARDLARVCHGGTRAVDGISFTVRRGEIFGFPGPNGSMGGILAAAHGKGRRR